MPTKDSTCNGYANYETWAVALWLNNDAGTQDYWHDVANQCREAAPGASQVQDGCWTVEDATRFKLANRLKDEVTDGSPVIDEASLYSDLLGSALHEVHWVEIADSILATIREDQTQAGA